MVQVCKLVLDLPTVVHSLVFHISVGYHTLFLFFRTEDTLEVKHICCTFRSSVPC